MTAIYTSSGVRYVGAEASQRRRDTARHRIALQNALAAAVRLIYDHPVPAGVRLLIGPLWPSEGD